MQQPLPQLTVKAVILGILLSMVLAGANAYLGLFAGLTVSASIPAAVISMGILRLFKESNILENNIVQTAASAGESLAAGVIFTMPALILLGYWDTFDYLWVTMIAGIGGLLGVLFTIPLRRSLIVEENLAFPEGTATAEVLKAGDSGSGVKLLALAALAGGLVKFADSGLRLWQGVAQGATFVGQGIAYIGSNLSPALLSVGYIVRLNIAVLVFGGGALAWYFGIPLYSAMFLDQDANLIALQEQGAGAAAVASDIWNRKIRYVGVGAMLLGGIWALFSMRKSLVSGVKSGMNEFKNSQNTMTRAEADKDMPMPLVLLGIALFVIPIFLLYWQVVDQVGISLALSAVMVITGFLFSSVAAYMAGLVGSSNNPISGITIATITFSAFLLLLLLGEDASNGPAAAIMVGAVVCCAAAIAGDNLQDLKAGYIVGATPWKQQVMQGVGVMSAALVVGPILTLLLLAYGFGPATIENPNSLQAPQATLMASVAQGVFGGGLPWDMIFIGMGVGAAVIFADSILAKRGSTFRMPVLAVAVGIYLPLQLSTAIFAGGLISWFSERVTGPDGPGRKAGILIAAGLITGEALIGILLALPIVISGDANVLSVANWAGLSNDPLGVWPGLIVMVMLCIWLYRSACRRDAL